MTATQCCSYVAVPPKPKTQTHNHQTTPAQKQTHKKEEIQNKKYQAKKPKKKSAYTCCSMFFQLRKCDLFLND